MVIRDIALVLLLSIQGVVETPDQMLERAEVLVDEDRLEKANALSNDAIEELTAAGDPFGEARSRKAMGVLYSMLGDHETARSETTRARKLAKQSGQVALLSRCLLDLSTIEVALGPTIRAEDRLTVLLDSEDLESEVAWKARYQLGAVLEGRSEVARAVSAYREGLAAPHLDETDRCALSLKAGLGEVKPCF